MAIVEEVPEDEPRQLHTTNKTELQHAIRALSARLALPEDLLPGFLNEEKAPEYTTLYRDRAEDVLREWLDISKSSAWKELAVEEQGEVFGQITRLYGDDEWTSGDIMTLIDRISTSVDTKPLAVHLLCHTLRPLFSASPPMLHPSTSRALSRPTGGPEALSDMHDTAAQIWKSPTAWGSYNILAWCTTHLPPSDITDHLGSILPPTLMMMDDWEPAWRGRGVWVLGKWVEAVPTQTMQRMGMDKLLLKSLLHTLSLHPNPPLPHVMPSTLDLIMRTSEGEKRADWIVEIMDKAILTGWMYAPSGAEGRPVLVQIAKDLEMVCEVIGTDIIRWLKSIIPNLLQPLSYHPTPAVLPHFEANLSALNCIIKCVLSTGRIDRWRGQIIDVISRLCVHIDERNREVEVVEYSPGQKAVMFEGLERSAREVYDLLFTACPSVRENEYQRLINVDQQVFERILRSVYTSA